jgi:hypothetical protein
MVGMTVLVWLTSSPAQQTMHPTPAVAFNVQPRNEAPVKQVRKTSRPTARHTARKVLASPPKVPVRVVKAPPVLGLAQEKPAPAPLRSIEKAPVQTIKTDPPSDSPVGKYGTAVDFWKNPLDADILAKKKDKLRFILHVSGNFEDPGCT